MPSHKVSSVAFYVCRQKYGARCCGLKKNGTVLVFTSQFWNVRAEYYVKPGKSLVFMTRGIWRHKEYGGIRNKNVALTR